MNKPTTNQNPKVNFDTPLQATSALQHDKLSRKGFAMAVTAVLRKVSLSTGLVVSIEGAWGSGKTSTLALIEQILCEPSEQPAPLIVHFNPWLIGDKDALLRHFLSRIAGAIKLSDNTRDGRKVASEIKAYSKAFDLVKLIPGAEPWASLIKSVVEAAGVATGAVADYKTPDIEAYKHKVEEALQKFPRPIIVFIDDIDRLFPNEVFEMVRIIKAVGALPNVGYVLAWDAAYVSGALENLGLPYASSYLDKVVQVRMPLPYLSRSARMNLMDDALKELDLEALCPRFRNQDSRLAQLYHAGLRDLLDQPRDFSRVFNAVQMMEPLLRDEVVFADILGLTALSVKAPTVFELLRKQPRLFVGPRTDDNNLSKASKDLIEDGKLKRSLVYEASSSPNAVRQVVHFLFPMVAKAEGSYAVGEASYVEGNIAHPAKLAIALQLSVSDGDVSIAAAKIYLQQPLKRVEVVASLNAENCNEFLDLLGDVGKSLGGEGISDLGTLCLEMASLPDQTLFLTRAKTGKQLLRVGVETTALRAVSMLVQATDESQMGAIAEKIAIDSVALSCSAEIINQSYRQGRHQLFLHLIDSADSKKKILEAFESNILSAVQDGALFDKSTPGFILWTIAQLAPNVCPNIYRMLREKDPTLDQFALKFLGSSWDSTKGEAYALPKEVALQSVFCPIDNFKAHAARRLEDESMVNPARAAWRSVFEGKSIYGVDGSVKEW